MPPAVELTGISHAFAASGRGLLALESVSLAAEQGEFVAILGPSGCGKSTLLRIAGGLLRPTRGEARIDGRPPAEAQRAKAIGFAFQDPSLLPWRTVEQNIRLPLEVGRRSGSAVVGPLLEMVGLQAFAGYRPHQLSGGMQQRVAIARALALSPRVLLMDEPFGALDAITRDGLRDELQRIWLSERPTVLFVTHSILEAVFLADRVVVLTGRPGKVAADVRIDLPRPREDSLIAGARFGAYAGALKRALRAGS